MSSVFVVGDSEFYVSHVMYVEHFFCVSSRYLTSLTILQLLPSCVVNLGRGTPDTVEAANREKERSAKVEVFISGVRSPLRLAMVATHGQVGRKEEAL